MKAPTCKTNGCSTNVYAAGMCGSHYRRFLRHGDPLLGRTKEGLPLAFIKDAISFQGNECLIWPFGRYNSGYGTAWYNGCQTTAHRAVCEEVHGAAPAKKMDAAHRCGVKLCVNPKHIRWATRSENELDKNDQGRGHRGELSVLSKLTSASVAEIRRLSAQGVSRRKLANRFAIHTATVGQIVRGDRWSWMTGGVDVIA